MPAGGLEPHTHTHMSSVSEKLLGRARPPFLPCTTSRMVNFGGAVRQAPAISSDIIYKWVLAALARQFTGHSHLFRRIAVNAILVILVSSKQNRRSSCTLHKILYQASGAPSGIYCCRKNNPTFLEAGAIPYMVAFSKRMGNLSSTFEKADSAYSISAPSVNRKISSLHC